MNKVSQRKDDHKSYWILSLDIAVSVEIRSSCNLHSFFQLEILILTLDVSQMYLLYCAIKLKVTLTTIHVPIKATATIQKSFFGP